MYDHDWGMLSMVLFLDRKYPRRNSHPGMPKQQFLEIFCPWKTCTLTMVFFMNMCVQDINVSSSNQTWQWKIHYSQVLFLLKP